MTSRPRTPRNDSPATRTTAHRPMRHGHGVRRGLTNVEGPTERAGDRALSEALEKAFRVRAGEQDATLTHPFHAYPARLHPGVARGLIALGTSALRAPDARLLDPFCGSGTVLIESMVSGLRARGSDLSTLAVELARLKTRVTTADERRAVSKGVGAIADAASVRVRDRAWKPEVPGDEATWYLPGTLREVAALRDELATLDAGIVRDVGRMLLSSILVKVSRQRVDSSRERMDKAIEPGEALRWFARKWQELQRGLAALEEAFPANGTRPEIELADATEVKSVPDGSIDLIVTSPPYANTYDYVDHHARRYAWLGLDPTPIAKGEIGSARSFKQAEMGAEKFVRDMAGCMSAMNRVLRPGGMAFVVLGDGAAGEEPVRAERVVADALAYMPQLRLQIAARVSQGRPVFSGAEVTAFKRTQKREHVVALVKGK